MNQFHRSFLFLTCALTSSFFIVVGYPSLAVFLAFGGAGIAILALVAMTGITMAVSQATMGILASYLAVPRMQLVAMRFTPIDRWTLERRIERKQRLLEELHEDLRVDLQLHSTLYRRG